MIKIRFVFMLFALGLASIARAQAPHQIDAIAAGQNCAAGLPIVQEEKPARPELDTVMQRFWAAKNVAGRKAASAPILNGKYGYEAVMKALKDGRKYNKNVARGKILRERIGVNGIRHPYMILVPKNYTPERKWPVRVSLHGGMGAQEWKKTDGSWAGGWLTTRDRIIILPAGWWDSMWWEWSQVENFESILEEVRRTWNTDENKVALFGNSDGGAALYFHAMRAPDRWASYSGYVAPPDRLKRQEFRPDGQMHLSNLSGQRFHLGFGADDRLVPIKYIKKYMPLFQEHGALLEWYALANQGHSLALPQRRFKQFIDFLEHTVRDPLPDKLTWATERTDRYHRRQWLVIELYPRLKIPNRSQAQTFFPVGAPPFKCRDQR